MAKQIPPPTPPQKKKKAKQISWIPRDLLWRKQNKYPEWAQETYYDTLVLSWAKHQIQIRSPVCAACCEPGTRHRYTHLFVQYVVSQAPDTDTLTCLCSMLWARHQTQIHSPVCAVCCEPGTRHRYTHLFVQYVCASQAPDTDMLTCLCSMSMMRAFSWVLRLSTSTRPWHTKHLINTDKHHQAPHIHPAYSDKWTHPPFPSLQTQALNKMHFNILIPREVAWQLDVGMLAQKLSLTFSSPSHIDHWSRKNDGGLCVPDKDAVWCQLAEIYIS